MAMFTLDVSEARRVLQIVSEIRKIKNDTQFLKKLKHRESKVKCEFYRPRKVLSGTANYVSLFEELQSFIPGFNGRHLMNSIVGETGVSEMFVIEINLIKLSREAFCYEFIIDEIIRIYKIKGDTSAYYALVSEFN